MGLRFLSPSKTNRPGLLLPRDRDALPVVPDAWPLTDAAGGALIGKCSTPNVKLPLLKHTHTHSRKWVNSTCISWKTYRNKNCFKVSATHILIVNSLIPRSQNYLWKLVTLLPYFILSNIKRLSCKGREWRTISNRALIITKGLEI